MCAAVVMTQKALHQSAANLFPNTFPSSVFHITSRFGISYIAECIADIYSTSFVSNMTFDVNNYFSYRLLFHEILKLLLLL